VTKIFIGNLSWKVGEGQLKELCERYGPVVDVFIPEGDMIDGELRGRGFGFATFEHELDALRFISELNGTMFAGRPLHVDRARERAPRQ
jgi:multiple RNA-binding domain-containing protein 1